MCSVMSCLSADNRYNICIMSIEPQMWAQQTTVICQVQESLYLNLGKIKPSLHQVCIFSSMYKLARPVEKDKTSKIDL